MQLNGKDTANYQGYWVQNCQMTLGRVRLRQVRACAIRRIDLVPHSLSIGQVRVDEKACHVAEKFQIGAGGKSDFGIESCFVPFYDMYTKTDTYIKNASNSDDIWEYFG